MSNGSTAAAPEKSADPTPSPSREHAAAPGRFWGLAIGSVGVVFGDIGTSPLYAFKAALGEAAKDGISRPEILGVLSLAIWALLLIVTLKYVLFLMRASNNGEGGVLSLMALAQRGLKGRTMFVFALGAIGAALFYGDGIITPAISVLSAVEGLKTVPGVAHLIDTQEVIIICLVILTGLFAFQARGTAKVARLFGPVMIVWFLVIGALGLRHILDDPTVLAAVSPIYAVNFLFHHGIVGLMVLGAVFLTVTGAEALTADMGHFGRLPIQVAWLALAFPALILNYLGQGAAALASLRHAEAVGAVFENHDWFFTMAPGDWRIALVVFSGVATVIASQAVITGAFSLTQQAIQLGLLPRMEIKVTSATEAGQIYVAPINWLLFVGVVLLVLSFRSSDSLAHAYGIAVTGTMVVTTCLAFIVVRHHWGWRPPLAAAVIAPFLVLDLTFFGANMLKVFTGGWVPLTLGAGLCAVMATWVRATDLVRERIARDGVSLTDFREMMRHRPPSRIAGAAVYLTADPETTPPALLHSLKHYRVLHTRNVILTVHNEAKPYISDDERVIYETLDENFSAVTLRYGYMEAPNIPKGLSLCRAKGLKFDIMNTSFFLSRRTVIAARNSSMALWQDKLYIFLSKNAADPAVFFHLPPARVVELGTQVAI
jgi:KUP system potassium uptake protein